MFSTRPSSFLPHDANALMRLAEAFAKKLFLLYSPDLFCHVLSKKRSTISVVEMPSVRLMYRNTHCALLFAVHVHRVLLASVRPRGRARHHDLVVAVEDEVCVVALTTE